MDELLRQLIYTAEKKNADLPRIAVVMGGTVITGTPVQGYSWQSEVKDRMNRTATSMYQVSADRAARMRNSIGAFDKYERDGGSDIDVSYLHLTNVSFVDTSGNRTGIDGVTHLRIRLDSIDAFSFLTDASES